MSQTIRDIASPVIAAAAAATTTDSYYSGPLPKLGFNSAMAGIFFAFLLYHTWACVYTKQWWFGGSFMCACILEVLGYIGRALSHQHGGDQSDYYVLQMVCLTIAPVFSMAGIYFQLAKLIEIYGHQFALLPNPLMYSYIFVACDIVSLAIQAAGGAMDASTINDSTASETGSHIFVAGLAVQTASMSAFLYLFFDFLFKIFVKTRAEYLGVSVWKWGALWKVKQSEIDHLYRPKYAMIRDGKRWTFRYFILAITAATVFIYIRCIYRLCELAEGWTGYLISHEWFFIALDALMVSFATLILSIWHPGFAIMGRHLFIPVTAQGRNHIDDADPESIHSTSESNDLNNTEEKTEPKRGGGVLSSVFRRKKQKDSEDVTTIPIEQDDGLFTRNLYEDSNENNEDDDDRESHELQQQPRNSSNLNFNNATL